MGDSRPIVSYDGRQPMRNAAPVIMKMDSDNDHLRPFLSPMLPQKMAPMGRSRNESANTANVCMSASAGSSPGKNTLAMTTAKYE